MHQLMMTAPHSTLEPVTDVFHGVAVTDPYRWLEDQESPRTRAWIAEQTRYARAYLDSISGRERIRERIREFLAVETYDSLQKAGSRYFLRKRLPDQEQPCICMREGADGEDQLLIDPAERGTGKYTAVKPLRVSPDGRLLLYEVKEGGERTGTFELLEIETRRRLPDLLPRGYLRGFAFAPDGQSFYYVHEALDAKKPFYRAAYQHVLGTSSSQDTEIFFAGEDKKIRLGLFSESNHLIFLVYRFLEKTLTDIYLRPLEGDGRPEAIFCGIDYFLSPRCLGERIFAITDRDASNRRIVEIHLRENGEHEWVDIVPETDTPINNWLVVGDQFFSSTSPARKPGNCPFEATRRFASSVVRRTAMSSFLRRSPSRNRLASLATPRRVKNAPFGPREASRLIPQAIATPRSGTCPRMAQESPCTSWAAAKFWKKGAIQPS